MSAALNRLWQHRSHELNGLESARPDADPYLLRARALDLGALLRRKRLIIAFLLIGALLGLGYALLRPQEFTATTSILVGAQTGNGDQVVSARGDFSRLEAELVQLRAERARLDAELQGADEIDFPAEVAQATIPGAAGLLERERRLLASRREALDKSISSLQQEHELYEGEVVSLGKQIELAASEQKFLDEELRGIRDLATRKLTTTPRLLDLERTAAVLASRRVELETELLRAQQRINETEQRIAEVRSKHEAEILAKRQEVEAEISEASARRDTARNLSLVSASNDRIDPGFLANEIEMISSDLVASSVVEQLGLANNEEWRLESFRTGSQEQEESAAEPTAVFQQQLSVSRVGAGSRVDISFTSPQPQWAAQAANAVASTYLSSKPQTDGAIAAETAVDPRVLRAAKPPTRPDGAGYLGILAAATMLGGIVGICLAFVLELLGVGARSRVAAAPARSEVAEFGRAASARAI